MIDPVPDLGATGWIILTLAVVLGGLVRGFCGFGTGLVFVPLAGIVLDPVWVLTVMVVIDVVGPAPLVPKVWPKVLKGEFRRLVTGMLVALPLGLFVLTRIDPDAFRYGASALVFLTLVVLVSGWRYRGAPTGAATTGVGLVSGFIGGSTGLGGPPVVLFYMASAHSAEVVRANTMVYLVVMAGGIAAGLAAFGLLQFGALVVGAIMVLPYTLATYAGGRIFRPDAERLFRTISYLLIAGAALTSLPVWG